MASSKNYKKKKSKKKEDKTKRKNKFMTKPIEYVGRVDHISPTFCFVIVDGKEDDIKIPAKNMRGSFHNDIVRVIDDNADNRVIDIIERARTTFIGKIYGENNRLYAKLDGKRMHRTIEIETEDIASTLINKKVVIEITSWPTINDIAKGIIKKVIGESGHLKTEYLSVLNDYGYETTFSQEIENELKKYHNFDFDQIEGRKSFINIPTFTIDPITARDHDDALSVEKLNNGNIKIGVHIADVSYFVKPDSELDKEAQKRGNSVYLAYETVPMLPELLSNNLCSLVPNKKRLALSAEFEFDEKNNLVGEWIGETEIYSNKKFSYEEAQQILDEGVGDYYNELKILKDTAAYLREERYKKGAIELESTDFEIELDDEGNPLRINRKTILETNKIVEEFMLLANRVIAKKFTSKEEKGDFVYRVHEPPDPEKLQDFAFLLKSFKYKFDKSGGNISEAFKKVSEHFKDKPQFPIIQSYGIKTMSRAFYSTTNLKHFGLAFDYYTHFTSPIRRYSDLLIHRIVKQKLKQTKESYPKELSQICKHLSFKERQAAESERISIKILQIFYLSNLKDEELKGVISYISEMALFVEIADSGCEGILLFSTFKDDFYYYDSKAFQIKGKRKGKKYKIGQIVNVKVSKIDFENRKVEFALI